MGAYTNQEIYDRMVELRGKIKREKEALSELEILFTFVKKLMDSSAETSFLVGAEFSSLVASERLSSAEQLVIRTLERVKQEELELKEAEADHIERMGRKKEEVEETIDTKMMEAEVKELSEPPLSISSFEDVKVSVFEEMKDPSSDTNKRFSFDLNSDEFTKITIKEDKINDIKLSVKEDRFEQVVQEESSYDDSKELFENVRAPDPEGDGYTLPTF